MVPEKYAPIREGSNAETASDATQPDAPPPIPLLPPRSWIEQRTRSAVGRDIKISGKLTFHEPIRIDGRFVGEATSTDIVIINAEAKAEGRIRAPRIVVLGELKGDLLSEIVVLGPKARVMGNIEAASLTVFEGAFLQGAVRMPQTSSPEAVSPSRG